MKKGSHHIEETKRKSGLAISRSLMWHQSSGETNAKIRLSNIGKHGKGELRNREVVARIQQSMMGHVVTAETRAKIATKATGRSHSVATREYLSRIQKGKVLSPETIAKMVKSRTGLKRSPEACQNISRGRKGIKFSSEHIANMRKALAIRMSDPEQLAKVIKMGVANKGRVPSAETRHKLSITSTGRVKSVATQQKVRELWSNPEYKDKRIRAIRAGCPVHPNKPETFFLNLLNTTYPNEWKYIGDGSFVIAGKNPDFVNVNGKKLFLEIFGDYWHKGENPQDRIDLFKQYGYDTLVIWERELKDKDKVLARLAEFVAMQTSLIHNKESV